MRIHSYAACICILAFMMPLQGRAESCPAHALTINAMRDCYRPLLIFAASTEDPKLVSQLQQLRQHSADLRERDVFIAIILATGQPFNEDQSQGLPLTQLPESEGHKLHQHFQVGNGDFAVLLVGKDGGEKFRSQDVILVKNLNATIDAMPMRQNEMHQR